MLTGFPAATYAQATQQEPGDQSAVAPAATAPPVPGEDAGVLGGNQSNPAATSTVTDKPDEAAKDDTPPETDAASTTQSPSASGPAAVTSETAPKSKVRAAFEANRAAATTETPSETDNPGQTAEPEKAAATAAVPVEKPLIVTSWSGAYGDAQRRAIIAPVARNLGIKIQRRSHAGAQTDVATADVTELDQSSLMAACRSGQVLKLDDLATRADSDDFVVAGKNRCGVPTFAWSSIVIANGAAMKKIAKNRYREPGKLSHLLDTKRYPGKRAMIRAPKRLLEMLLLADGVSRDELYARLSTRQGQDQAFEILDRLNGDILWVDGSRDALLALDSGQATFAMTYSGRAFRRLIASRLHAIWDGHIMDYASWAVSATSTRPDEARRFILAATTAESLAAQARLWPYGPMRRSALPLAQRHDLLDTELGPFMPTSEMRFSQGVVLNAGFWAEYGTDLQRRFDDWRAGVPMGIRVPVPTQAPPAPAPPIPRRNG